MMISVIVFLLSSFVCMEPPCAIEVSGRRYRELVFDPRRRFQTYASLPMKLNHYYLPVEDAKRGHYEYWVEDADAWLSHKLKPTVGNRTIEFFNEREAIMTVQTRGIPPYITFDGDFLGTEEFIRYRISAGKHALVWITSELVDPRKGDGYQEPIQTAAWLEFTRDDNHLAMSI
jgi:hypothetical protein